MKILFAGTPQFSAQILSDMIAAGFAPTTVLTQAPKPKGRGRKLLPSEVEVLAREHGIKVLAPEKLKEVLPALTAEPFDIMVTASYGKIIPKRLLDHPKFGAINVHTSLLPRWRGAAPIQRAIMSGDEETGVTLMQMDVGLDTGNIHSMLSTPIENKTSGMLHEELAQMGSQLTIEFLKNISASQEAPEGKKQPDNGITYAEKIEKEEAQIEFNQDAFLVARKINALSPAPGAWCMIEGERLKILKAAPTFAKGEPGQIASIKPLIICCAKGAIELEQIQLPGKKALSASQVINGKHPFVAGQILS